MSQYYNTHQSTQSFGAAGRITWAVQRLILFTGGAFALQLLAAPLDYYVGARYGVEVTNQLGFLPSRFLSGHLWEPVTYIFLHGGLMHLTMNLGTLYFFGPDVERHLGTPQFFRLFFFCGILGVFTTLVPYLLYGREANVIGASGAIMGVLVAFVILDPQRQVYILPFPTPITALWLVIILIGFNIITSLQGDSISVATHFGGMAAGYVYMKFVPKWTRLWRRRKFKVVPKSPPPTSDAPPSWDKVGKMVNDILKDKERDFFDGDKR